MAKNLIEKIEHNGDLLAIIIRKEYEPDGLEFFSEPHLGQQVAMMRHKKGHIIQKHIHKSSLKEIRGTTEVLLILDGLVEMEIYNKDREFVKIVSLRSGDVLFLISGGHGFKILEDSKMLEVKQGPYSEKEDKEKF